MAGLLVSVRSAAEALAALAGGAAVIDVKEPARGPLGRADVETWRSVLDAVSREFPPLPPGEGTKGPIPVSVALGELFEWHAAPPCPADFAGLAYRKLGLARSGPDWAEGWARLRRSLGDGPPWVAVIYADWPSAGSPRPDDVLDVALDAPECAGVLVDTWDKSRPTPLDLSWAPLVRRARSAGRFVALAGGLDAPDFSRLAPLAPDLFAVRGAACGSGDRLGTIDPDRVARLARAAGLDEFARTGPSL